MEWKDSLFNVLHLALAEPLCKQMAIAIFSDLICAQYLLKESEVSQCCHKLSDRLWPAILITDCELLSAVEEHGSF